MRIVKTLRIVALAAMLVSVCSGNASAASATTGGQPKSLMIQVSTWSTSTSDLVSKMNYVCSEHRNPANPGLIQNLVLTDVASADPNASPLETTPTANDVLLTDRLNALLPYFPGGNGPCNFDNVFVGTIDLNGAKPAGAGDSWITYREGIKDPNFRTNMLQRSLKVAQAFQDYVSKSNNPKVLYHWYVSQESLLDLFTDPAVEQGYEAFMIEHIKDLSSVAPNRAFVWSPGFQVLPYNVTASDKTLLESHLKTFFNAVRAGVHPFNSYHANDGGPIWLHMQDHVGSMASSSPTMTKEDAANWYFFLNGLYPFTMLGMNVGQYTTINGNCCFAADSDELMSREQYYLQQKIGLGAAFELRYWYSNNHP
ncbi:hypothetical protein AWB70_00189 [Caballeronia cordobensis]|uniref:GH26 domain-containing protein n=1 Tax=Caballeronia cordobensis TaxID=1353886 RepID=A0A158ESK2_CABCO|nr:hypothetical protein [Caballeronia cordobensis]SAL10527.1 hypothetical protein AWB70_00189 [Caballeronia cordobensis]